MSSHALGILIGGLTPAILYGISNLFIKASNQAGIGVGWYLLIIGIVTCGIGLCFLFLLPAGPVSMRSGIYAAFLGLFWALGTGAIAIAQARYHTPLSVVVPFFNMNTLVTVLLALWIFAEWKQVRIPQLLLGSVLIVVGGIVVTRA